MADPEMEAEQPEVTDDAVVDSCAELVIDKYGSGWRHQALKDVLATGIAEMITVLDRLEESGNQIAETMRQMQDRLVAAEQFAVAYGWAPSHTERMQDRVAHELYQDWVRLVGLDFTDFENHPEITSRMVELDQRFREKGEAKTAALILPPPARLRIAGQ